MSKDDKTWRANNLSEDDKTWRANNLSEDDVNGLFLFCNFQMLILGLVVLHDIQIFLKHGFYFICDVNIMIYKMVFQGLQFCRLNEHKLLWIGYLPISH